MLPSPNKILISGPVPLLAIGKRTTTTMLPTLFNVNDTASVAISEMYRAPESKNCRQS